MKLSAHFTLAELTRSDLAERQGLDNQPGPAELDALGALCRQVLERIRQGLGQPVLISSGYRSAAVNAAAGGADGSQHRRGEAADFTVAQYTVTEVFNWLVFTSGIDFDQAIFEFGQWIHVSHTAHRPNRRQALRAERIDGQVRYQPVAGPLPAPGAAAADRRT